MSVNNWSITKSLIVIWCLFLIEGTLKAQHSDSLNIESSAIIVNSIDSNIIIKTDDDTISENSAITSTKKKEKKRKKIYDFRGKPYSPGIAGGLSVIPGLGQIYNRSYWKLPIVYCGLGVIGYFIYDSATKMKLYGNEYNYRSNHNNEIGNTSLVNLSMNNLYALQQYHWRNLEICVIACVAFYTLTILEAIIDAHLSSFDISDNLSLHIRPFIEKSSWHNGYNNGISLCFKFNKK